MLEVLHGRRALQLRPSLGQSWRMTQIQQQLVKHGWTCACGAGRLRPGMPACLPRQPLLLHSARRSRTLASYKEGVAAPGGDGGRARVVALDAADGHDGVGAVAQRLRDQELQLAHLGSGTALCGVLVWTIAGSHRTCMQLARYRDCNTETPTLSAASILTHPSDEWPA